MSELIFDAVTYILHNTNDGDDLTNNDLGLVEAGANGILNPRGEVVLIQLKHKIESGTYTAEPLWFCGIENLTRGKGDDRSVFWRDIRVEHFDHDFWCEEGYQERMKKDAQQVAKTCQWMEGEKIDVNGSNYLKYCSRFNHD